MRLVAFYQDVVVCKTVTKRKRTRDEEEKEQPTKFTLEESVEKFRKAVVAKQVKEMMDAIDGVDIMLKNFRKHESCWRQYVSVLRKVEKVKTEDPYYVVRMAIQETVLGRKICMSLDTLLELLGITKHDASTRKVMKKWVKRNFEHEVMFLSGEEKKGQLIISKTCLDDIGRGVKVLHNTVPLTNETSLRHASLVLRRMILHHTENSSPLPWPPRVSKNV